jgi:hypothetical protein
LTNDIPNDVARYGGRLKLQRRENFATAAIEQEHVLSNDRFRIGDGVGRQRFAVSQQAGEGGLRQ